MTASKNTPPIIEDVADCLREVEAFAAANGIKPETVVRQATGNPRLYSRLPGHSSRLSEQVATIRAWVRGEGEGANRGAASGTADQ